MSTRRFLAVAFALFAAACGATAAGPPAIVVDRTACSHCGMFVSEPAYAAAYQARGKDVRVFDDIGCMLEAFRHEAESPIEVWVQDAAGVGWLPASAAIFVTSPNIRTPMNGGVLAYADATAAGKSAAAIEGTVIRSFETLVSSKGDEE